MNGNNLMCAIQMYDFYLYELNLYLDTHPTDRQALDLFKKYTELKAAAYDAYISKYGPITADQSSTDERFNWVDDPWPWERSANR
ncbi:MAG: spore coat protein CotJB [Oscillospiraceae bacterium]|nr:spore coat protein CotJB [Oscillospiraceae bacterium]MDE7280069.1 spore coat protein CotJB [Oscillospiraceae bacterium]